MHVKVAVASGENRFSMSHGSFQYRQKLGPRRPLTLTTRVRTAWGFRLIYTDKSNGQKYEFQLREVATDYVLVGGTVERLTETGQALSFGQLSSLNPAAAVNAACSMLLGPVGAALAVLGVVVLPITSGDTAMRSCRLILADALHLPQQHVGKRLLLALPLFAVVIAISQVDFSVIWRYFGWANQVLSCFTLWSIAACLRGRGRFHWLATLPASFMTAVCVAYLLESKDCGICLSPTLGNAVAGAVSALCCVLLLVSRFSNDHDIAQKKPDDGDERT